NSLKFTPRDGRVTLEVTSTGTEARIAVMDTGEGMTSVALAKLFKPFVQAYDTMERTRSGWGLGLFISRRIAEDHGGRLWAESPGLGKGSTFYVSLPLGGADAAQTVQDSESSSATA